MKRALTSLSSLLIAAVFAAACDNAPTAPDARLQAHAKPLAILGFGPTWHSAKLGFRPKAINDAGMIVGAQGSLYGITSAVRWQNGVLSPLGASSASSCQGNADATAVSPSGIAAGTANGCVVVWTTPGVDPVVVLTEQNGGLDSVFAVYDDQTVLGSHRVSGHLYAFQYSVVSGLSLSPDGFIAHAADGFGNVYGTFNGLPARWSAAHGLSSMPLLAGYTGGNIDAADARGDAIGYVYTSAPGSVRRAEWNANGTVSMLVNLPNNLTSLNGAGRFVGSTQLVFGQPDQVWTSFNGSLAQLASPDSLGYATKGVNSCGSIIADAETGAPGGALFTRTSLTTPVCDQPPVAK